ncbi:MAG: hypothetical protein DHS20C14_10980 [Phycisphaeraceae bacterium]|nr:MAG: hypothetical protein DHS20C14_10980 [Phycisphaeraceae bacterium]
MNRSFRTGTRSLLISAAAASLGAALLASPAAAQQQEQPQQPDRQSGDQTEPATNRPIAPARPRVGDRANRGSTGEIVFVESEVDMGEVLDSEKPVAEFRFKAIGPGPITLTRIKPDCGCTVATLVKITHDDEGNEVREEIDAKLLPKSGLFQEGDEGIISATYDATRRQGVNVRNIRINTDSNKQRNVSVQLKVNVLPLVFSDPRVITFGNAIKKGETPSRTIRVFGRTEGFEVTKATLSNLKLNKQVEIEIVEHGFAEYEGEQLPMSVLKLTLTSGMSPGVISDKLFVRTNDERRPVFEIQVIGKILGDVQVEPAALRLGRMAPGKEVTQEFRASSRDGKPFTIKGVTLDNDAIVVTSTFKPIDPENPTDWLVTITARGVTPNTRVNSKIMLETDVPLEETVEVRFYGVVGE